MLRDGSSSTSLSSICGDTPGPIFVPLSSPKKDFLLGPFDRRKFRVLSKTGAGLAEGERLVVTVQRSCVLGSSKDSFSRKVYAEAGDHIKSLSKIAVPYHLEKDYDLSEFEGLVEGDACIIGVSRGGKVKLAANGIGDLSEYNDPYVNLQQHLFGADYNVILKAFGTTTFAPLTFTPKIAVVDTGVDCAHPDLSSNCWDNSGAVGAADQVDNDTDPADTEGHGTHVAGIIGAVVNNSEGIVGVMGEFVEIMAVRVIGPSGGDISDVKNGVQYAIDNGANVINMSLGADVGINPDLEQAVIDATNAGIFVAMAAGNKSKRFDTDGYRYEPAYYGDQINGAMSVASVNAATELSYFSNYHPVKVEIAAMGNESGATGIYSTWTGSSYQREAGTSMASPQVAAAAGLLISFYETHGISYNVASLEQDISKSVNIESDLAPYFESGRVLNFSRLAVLAFQKAGTNAAVQLCN